MRPDILNPLFAEVTSLKGVGPGLAKPLERLRIARVVDVAFHLPTGHIDRFPRDELMVSDAGRVIAISLTVKEHRVSSSPRGPTRVRAEDARGNSVALVYFGGNSGWVKKLLPVGETKIVSGRLDLYGQDLQIVHPDLGDSTEDFREREAIYPLSEGITSRRLGALAAQAVERAPELPEWIEPGLKAQRGWPDWKDALARIHADPADAKARERLGYDEVFANQLAMTLVRADTRKRRGRALNGDGRLRDMLKLPYTLTGAQSRTVREIEGDLAQDAPMLRLLQGDVGAGKTLVAAMAMLIAVEAGAQAAMLAPTEILARQHYETLRKTLAGLPVEIAVLTGRDKGKAREATLMALAAGEIDILVGTHAIFQETVTYRDLALVVVDEQHRFGVAQRMMLSAKGKAPPHLLAMTATPIPRTLTLANYGEMDVSRLDEMPPGRQPIETRVVSEDRLDEVVNALGRHLSDGGQAYWVCPLVEESEKSDLAAAEMRAESLRARFGERVGLVHGKMKPAEKDAVMEAFAGGRLGVLVATTVIEVGVDVPNATLIVIEHADRFGLAQLHQLRGRVGRGGGLSRCLLLRGSHLSETSRARLALMRETNDGFRIAEEDLRLRGAGELLGTRQSGELAFRLATPENMADLMQCAQDDARLLIDRDGGLEAPRGQAARTALYLFERDAGVALLRSG
ncbi:OB-fold nucleic acid binding domain protein [Sphingomonas sp. S17]|uniref:ATP-dependent DNA helicase RecG n=3 Tax=Pseudomonadota TaxID=1224 RepID=A0A411LGG6_SPHPI|nr:MULTISPECIES: ATP-dependent DNA helicase RecG [Sphingomonas]EGI56051.1 OB-fold nucleic acid binding domain protein [Sphingomonas sp. S17]MBQ1481362.1 ATP-dependent DNA helicase RecG [Sphingomonas sp.]MCM3679504.1 ATP-dependent DNA helicase RecG [Sphingomonas paucimobilis]MDG5972219.1 ATP-dependent DNA helicase RecG [Sphingomonas paucimobilis]NNG57800.1 ATP-dependent DNA helicase RecG [Sphingomonas paucimobilis]